MNVQGPNGEVVNFPDGTDSSTVDKVMRQNFSAAPKQGLIDPYANNTLGQDLSLAGRVVNDGVRNFTNGATLGYADKIAAGLSNLTGIGGPPTVEGQRALSDTAMAHAGPWLGNAERIAGMAAPAAVLGEVLPAGYLGATATGATIGGIDAAGNDQPIVPGTIIGAASGAGGQLVANGLTGAASKVAGMFNPAPLAPIATDAAKSASQGLYGASENAGISITPQAAQRLAGAVTSHMLDRNWQPELDGAATGVLRTLGGFADVSPYAKPTSLFAPGYAPSQTPSLADIDALRQLAQRSGSIGPSIAGKINDFIDTLTPADTVGGDLAGGRDALRNAQELWQTFRKSEAVDNATQTAADNASKTGSGGNINNATRQQADKLLKGNTSWTPDEKTALQGVVDGTLTGNALRQLGKLSPSGNGLMAALNLGGVAAGGPTALAVPALGLAAKTAADRMTTGAMGDLSTLVRSGGVNPPILQNFAQKAAQQANVPITSALTNTAINASVNNAAPDSRAAQLAALLAQHAPPPEQPAIGSVFQQQ